MIKKDNITYEELCREGLRVLQGIGIEDAAYDSVELMLYVTGMSRTQYLIHGRETAGDDIAGRYAELIQKRSEHIPLQHITGEAYFYGRCYRVNGDVLIPRQDTEILVEEVLKCADKGSRVLDMCTGSGCIAITIALEAGCESVIGADISLKAIEVAKYNAKLLGADNIHFLLSNLFENISEQDTFDIIVSNPPYIRTDDIAGLSEEVKLHDPVIALDGHDDGLYFYERITQKSVSHIANGGMLIYEIGFDQAEDVVSIMQSYGYTDIRVIKDLAGLDRVVAGKLK